MKSPINTTPQSTNYEHEDRTALFGQNTNRHDIKKFRKALASHFDIEKALVKNGVLTCRHCVHENNWLLKWRDNFRCVQCGHTFSV